MKLYNHLCIRRMGMKTLQLRNKLNSLLFLIFLISSLESHALRFEKDFIWGVLGGFGGTGIEKSVDVEGQLFQISRSEVPGMIGISVETFIHSDWSVAIAHRRGFRFGPFSMGVGFTGTTVRYYPWHDAPIIPKSELEASFTLLKWAPFVGGGVGIANGSIDRERDVVGTISSSGVFFGFHAGFDYHWLPRLVVRPEILFSTTIIDTSAAPATLREFGAVVGLHFRM